ncbi:MAG: hypothetical protein ACK5LX_12245 [Oscillospiraceae bacterium]
MRARQKMTRAGMAYMLFSPLSLFGLLYFYHTGFAGKSQLPFQVLEDGFGSN